MPLFNWPYTNLHNLNLDWIIKKIKNVETAETNTAASEEAAAGSASSAAESEANAAASETNAAASATAAGNYYNQIRENVSTLVTGWMDEHITPTTPPVDDTLTIQGAAADAKKTGDEITDLKNAIEILDSDLEPYNYKKVPVPTAETVSNTAVNGKTGEIITLSGWQLTYFPVKKGQKLDATVRYSSNVSSSYSFASAVPAVGVTATVMKLLGETTEYTVNHTFTEDGYFIISSAITSVTIAGTLESGKILKDEINNIYTNMLAVSNGYEQFENVSVNTESAVVIATGEVDTTRFAGYTKWATSELYKIPLGTIKIESNFNEGASYTELFGFAVYDENKQFIIGGQDLSALTIADNYKYIRLTNYNADSDHSGLYVKFVLRDISNESAFTGKNCICFGDSITWYDGNAYNWGKFAGQTAKGFESWLREVLDLTVTNAGVGGNTSIQICNRLKDTNLTNYDFLTLTAGANDERHNTPLGVVLDAGSKFDTTTFCGAFQSAIEYALAQNDEMKIILCTPIQGWIYSGGYDETDYPTHPLSGDIDPKWANAIKHIAEIYALPVCDWYTLSGINLCTRNVYINDPEPPTNTLYSLHPTPKGYKRMSEILISTFEMVAPLE